MKPVTDDDILKGAVTIGGIALGILALQHIARTTVKPSRLREKRWSRSGGAGQE